MLAASESQCTAFTGVREVAGTVNSKSSATNVPDKLGDERVPNSAPLSVAFPSTRNGMSVGPPNAFTNGRHSSRLDVEIENLNLEDAARVPSPVTFDEGVVKLNCASSSESLLPRYFP